MLAPTEHRANHIHKTRLTSNLIFCGSEFHKKFACQTAIMTGFCIFPKTSTHTSDMKTKSKFLIGVTAGVLNGLFGSGGGVVAVPLLERSQLEQRKCHATSVVLIFVLSMFTAILYALNGKLDVSTAVEFIPSGILGAIVGATLLKKIQNTHLKRVFGVIILISAFKMLM